MCGITLAQQFLELNELGVDYGGMIFYKPSKRSMADKLLPSEVNLPNLKTQKVGVFVNENANYILEQVQKYGLQLIQLHGDETVAFCNYLSDYVKVIKAFRIGDDVTDIDRVVNEYIDACDYYLFDKASVGVFGGTGMKFNWETLANAKINKPFFLSGGLAVEEVESLKEFTHPYLYSYDINSRFEIEPGVKNMELIKEFITKIKS